MFALVQNDLELLEGVDNESASELEFDSEGVDGESEDLSKNEVRLQYKL